MKLELTAVLEAPDGPENPFWDAYCPQVPGARGQGGSEEQCLENLWEAVELMYDVMRDEALKTVSPTAKTRAVRVA